MQKPIPDGRQNFGQVAATTQKAVALSLAAAWHGPEAVSYLLMIDGREFAILTATPSLRWLGRFRFGAGQDIPADVSRKAWADVGPLVLKLAADAAVELLKLNDDALPKISAMLAKAGEMLAAKPVPCNPSAVGRHADGQ